MRPYLTVPLEGHIRQVWLYLCFIRYICDWNLQFLNNVIGDHSQFWLSCLSLNAFNLFGFPLFRFWAYLLKVIPETHWHTKFDIYVFIAIRIISKLSPLGPTGTRDAILSYPVLTWERGDNLSLSMNKGGNFISPWKVEITWYCFFHI